jgi:hypothetical protein
MTTLIETVARALVDAEVDDCRDIAQVALSAIEAAGYRIVPVQFVEDAQRCGIHVIDTRAPALAVAPKVTE